MKLLLVPALPEGLLKTPEAVDLLQGAGHHVSVLLPAASPYKPYFDAIAETVAADEGGYDGVVLVPGSAELRSQFPHGIGYSDDVLEELEALHSPQDYAGKTVLVTAGPTVEDIDPARFVSNRSTGQMGVAIANAVVRRGGRVLLVHGPMGAKPANLPGLVEIPVRSAWDMFKVVREEVAHCQIAVLCAAVADFSPCEYSEDKIKKGTSQFFTLKMQRTPDILAYVGSIQDKPFLVGFAAESNDVRKNAMDKLRRKHCDMLCANDITEPGCGFAVSTNRLMVFAQDGTETELPLASKKRIANSLLDLVLAKNSSVVTVG